MNSGAVVTLTRRLDVSEQTGCSKRSMLIATRLQPLRSLAKAKLMTGASSHQGSPVSSFRLLTAVLADLTLPLERNRLVALVQSVEQRARSRGRADDGESSHEASPA